MGIVGRKRFGTCLGCVAECWAMRGAVSGWMEWGYGDWRGRKLGSLDRGVLQNEGMVVVREEDHGG